MVRSSPSPPAAIPRTKLQPPRVPADSVRRRRLETILAEGAGGRLSLLSAPAGSGKTVLLSSWLQSGAAPEEFGWLSVSSDDGPSPRFWRAFVEAIEAGTGKPIDARPVDVRSADVVGQLVNAMAARDRQVSVVVDDFQELRDENTLGQIATLIGLAPPQLRIVISSRVDPGLAVHKLRLAGELTEIRGEDLAFTPSETRELLGEQAEALDDGDIETLCERTEGWAAGLRLAALSLRQTDSPHEFVEHFAGDDHAVADYLLTEVLEHMDPEDRAFLLRTAVPDRLPAELASHLTERRDAPGLLGDLAARNTFLIRHGNGDGFYRYHQLFHDFLRVRASTEIPHELPELHHRTARWLARSGSASEAVRHALLAGNWSYANAIVSVSWHDLVFGEERSTVRSLVDRIPAEALEGEPALGLLAGISHLDNGQIEAARRYIEFSGRTVEEGGEEPLLVRSLLAFGRLYLARLEGDAQALAVAARELLYAPPTGLLGTYRQSRVQRAVALSGLGVAAAAEGDLDTAEVSLEEGLALASEENVEPTTLSALSELSLVEVSRGRLSRAAELGAEAVSLAEHRGWTSILEVVDAYVGLGWVHFNWNEIDTASLWAERAVAAARVADDRHGRVAAATLTARVLGAQGPKEAEHGLIRLRAVRNDLTGWQVPPYLADSAICAEPRLLAARGDLSAAWHALEGLTELMPGFDGAARLTRGRLELTAANPLGALEELDGLAEENVLHVHALRLEATVLNAVAYFLLRRFPEARSLLEAALDQAARDRFRRVFYECGPVVGELLRDHIRHGTRQRAFAGELLAGLERNGADGLTRHELLEPLSAKETAILRYLPTMMSNSEIAGELFVSVNTVKTHLRSIYRKLGVSRRRDAVERARQLELL
ncbi:MAG TPA: LuxR C-terminal-related transcriptional regulator [Gaiellaceae bacterium]